MFLRFIEGQNYSLFSPIGEGSVVALVLSSNSIGDDTLNLLVDCYEAVNIQIFYEKS